MEMSSSEKAAMDLMKTIVEQDPPVKCFIGCITSARGWQVLQAFPSASYNSKKLQLMDEDPTNQDQIFYMKRVKGRKTWMIYCNTTSKGWEWVSAWQGSETMRLGEFDGRDQKDWEYQFPEGKYFCCDTLNAAMCWVEARTDTNQIKLVKVKKDCQDFHWAIKEINDDREEFLLID